MRGNALARFAMCSTDANIYIKTNIGLHMGVKCAILCLVS